MLSLSLSHQLSQSVDLSIIFSLHFFLFYVPPFFSIILYILVGLCDRAMIILCIYLSSHLSISFICMSRLFANLSVCLPCIWFLWHFDFLSPLNLSFLRDKCVPQESSQDLPAIPQCWRIFIPPRWNDPQLLESPRHRYFQALDLKQGNPTSQLYLPLSYPFSVI